MKSITCVQEVSNLWSQGADGALAGLALNVTEGLDQLGVAPIARLGDLDEHGVECSSGRENENY